LNLFDLTLRAKGFPIKEAKAHLQEIQAIPEAEYSGYLEKAKADILQYHLRHNPFYKSFIGGTQISNWEDIPVLHKKDLQVPLQKRLSKNFSLKKVYKGRTSGSSGTPLHYGKDNFCHALTWALIKDRFGWFGIDFNTSLQARFYGIPLDIKGYHRERLKDWFSKRYRFPIFDLSEKKMESFLKRFRKKKFDYINGHTSSIVLFAKFLANKGLILSQECPTLKVCVVTSEMLFPDDKVLLEEQLGIPVINEYGASELDLLAFTNTADEFQLNSESVFIEVVNEQGRPVPNGTPGSLLVTMLYNKAHPFIRYEVGDLGVLDEKSTLKKPILKELLGRANDNATLANGTTVPGHTFYYVAKSAMGKNSTVKEFVMAQNSLELFTLTYVADRDLNPSEISAFKKSLDTYLGISVTLQCTRVDMLERQHRGKLKQFISHL
jgi:phenylacetate-coenzyme A ligase PaaK-like adenylate-forming protein